MEFQRNKRCTLHYFLRVCESWGSGRKYFSRWTGYGIWEVILRCVKQFMWDDIAKEILKVYQLSKN